MAETGELESATHPRRAAEGSGRDPARAGGAFWPAVIIAFGLFSLYMLTRSRIHTWDAIAYAARAASDPLLADRYFSSRLFHPHHLLYAPLAVLAHRLLALVGLARDPFLPLQLMSATFGAASALLAGTLARRLGASEAAAAQAAIATGVSNAVWRFSTEALVMVPSLFFLLLGAVVAARARTRAAWLGAGVSFAGAVLIHQSAAVFAAAASVALLVIGRSGRSSPGATTAFTLGWVLPTATAYLAVGGLETGGADPRALAHWMVSAAHRGTSAHLAPFTVLKEAADGLAESWVTLTPLRAMKVAGGADPGSWPGALSVAVALVGAAALGLTSLPSLMRATAGRGPATGMLLAGALASAGLVTWFQPWNHAYWVYLPPLGCALTAAYLPPGSRAARRAVPALLMLVAAANLVSRALPATDASRAPYADLIAFAHGRFHEGDLLVCGGADSPIGEGIIAIPFFARVPVVLVPRAGMAEDSLRFRRLLGDGIVATVARGGTVFALDEALGPIRTLRPAMRARPVGTLRGDSVYALSDSAGP